MPLLAQDKKSETQTTDDGSGGKITTTYSVHEGKNIVEKVHRDAQGKLLDKSTEISGPDGATEEFERYDSKENLTSKSKYEKDRSGKIVGSEIEYYTDGVLVQGEIAVLKPGATHQTVVKKWNNLQGKYVDVPLEEQQKQAEDWKKFEENLKKSRAEHEKWFKLLGSGKVSITATGTGETIGHVADIKIQNLSNQALAFTMPPVVLESRSGRNQDYGCPHPKTVNIGGGATEVIPEDGTCLERNKSPVSKGASGDLMINTGDPETPTSGSHFTPKETRDLIRVTEAKYETAKKLERDGAFKDFPYRDKEKRKEIAVQWSTWSDPRVSSITHSPAAIHDDFRKVINDQVDQHGPITREARKKIDKSSDKMWDGIALTGEKAKDLEHPDVYADVGPSGGTFNISDEQPTPATPKTDEKKPANKITKLEVLKTKEEKEEDKRHDEFKNKGKAVKLALFNKLSAYNAYNAALHSYLDKNKAYAEQKAKLDKAKLKADASGASQPDKDSYSAADAELKKLRAQLEKEFQLTAEGQKTFGNLNSAGEATDKAVAAYQPAGLLSKDLLKGTPEQELKLARAEYEHAFDQFLEKNNDYKEFQAAVDKAREKAKGSGSLTDFSGALTNLDHLKGQLEKDFQKTPEGRKALEKVNDTQKAADKTPK